MQKRPIIYRGKRNPIKLLQRIEFALEARGRYAKETYYRGKRNPIKRHAAGTFSKVSVCIKCTRVLIFETSANDACMSYEEEDTYHFSKLHYVVT